MAIDEALLHSFNPGSSLPVLRLYRWAPPALSLGRFQRARDVLDIERCTSDRIPVIRRITGGGIIYHDQELTYSIVCSPDQIPAASSVKDSFRVLTGFLLACYRRMGLDPIYAVDMPGSDRLGERTSFCFAGRESFDILVNGKKLGGNAQRRLKGIIFQHGSIPLQNCANRGLAYLQDRDPLAAEGACSLSECNVRLSPDELHHHLVAGFEETFGTALHPEQLTEQESDEATALGAAKYTRDEWNLEGESHAPSA